MWTVDPDPGRTLSIHAQIQAAVESGGSPGVGDAAGQLLLLLPLVAYLPGTQTVKVNGKRLSPPRLFTFDVSGQRLVEGRRFVRRILLGPFQSTSEVDYCDPESGHHDDD